MTEIAMPKSIVPKGSGTSEEPKEPAKRSTPWRDNIEAMLMAIVMALVLKYFIVEAYRIPTGSMQPTLMGNTETQIFDRILVDKFTPVLRDPRRFETWVFRYPLDGSKNFVKRIVGVGPEDFRVSQGDLWSRSANSNDDWEILRRSRRVQGETWLALIKEDAQEALFYDVNDNTVSWSRSVRHAGDFRMRYSSSRASVMDRYNDGYPDGIKDRIVSKRHGGSRPIGDLRVSGEVTPTDTCEWVEAEIQEGTARYFLRIPGPAAPDGAKPSIVVQETMPEAKARPFETSVEGEPMRLRAGSSYTFGAQNLDNLLELEVDGDVVCSLEIPGTSMQRSSLYLSNKGGVTFKELMVYRDIYYTVENSNDDMWTIPEGHFFMMGDNTNDSSDSRMWKLHRINHKIGDGEFELLEGNDRRSVFGGQSDFFHDMNPYTSSLDPNNPRPITWFRDTLGEMHTLEAGDYQPASPMTMPAPFVPRDKMLGRAISVFWPIKPFDDVWRFKWVH